MLQKADDCDIKIMTDASGVIGMGGCATTDHYFTINWTEIWPSTYELDIYFGETLAVSVLMHLMRHLLVNKSVAMYIDNENSKAAFIKKKAKAKRKEINRLLRATCYDACRHQFKYWVLRVPTKENIIADALSRNEDFDPKTLEAKYGHYPVDIQFTKQEIIQATKKVLGSLWNGKCPPNGTEKRHT